MEATFLGQCVLKEYEVKPNSRITEVECETLITLQGFTCRLLTR